MAAAVPSVFASSPAAEGNGMNQQRLKLKPPRRRPTLAYVLELERRYLLLQAELEQLRRGEAAALARLGARLAG